MTLGPEIELVGKCVLAAVLGYVVGLERELMGSPAGDRTFSLVALGSALYTGISFEVFGSVAGDAPGRIAANIVTGVGFLGAGMILKESGSGQVRGLTTAAGIWAIAGVGMAVGSDRYLLGVLVAALIMVIFAVERVFSFKRHRDRRGPGA